MKLPKRKRIVYEMQILGVGKVKSELLALEKVVKRLKALGISVSLSKK